jgi:hypothetical protein
LEKFEQTRGEKKHSSQAYVLINSTPQTRNTENIDKIKTFVAAYPDYKKIYFPCDINDDTDFFIQLKKYIPELEYYNRIKHSLTETLDLFYEST